MLDNPNSRFEVDARTVIQPKKIYRNLTPPLLYEEVIRRGEALVAENGPLVIYTGKCTGRSPNDKFFVRESSSEDVIWWGKVNKPFDADKFDHLKERILEYFGRKELFVQDCYGGADPAYRFPARIITDTAWENLFAYNMFIHADPVASKDFSPEFTVMVASDFEADPAIDGTRSDVVVAIHLGQRLALIAGTRYAGEIKKTVFTVLNYLFPLQGILPMHCSANIGVQDDTALFFGLSGTGKTTLSADPKRRLIGDDEHGWSDQGIFNFEGGCYAKVIRLSAKDEPEIFGMTHRFGTILENVVIDFETRKIDLCDETITENTRASYQLDQLDNFEPSGMGKHPDNVIFLTADAFGVLPPISRLTPEQAMYHFLSGYTAKVAGTEKGIKEPQATFSTCFGGPFMVHHPMVYAKLLGEKIRKHQSKCWLINTGWTGGPYGIGQRMKIAYTRAMIDALLSGALDDVAYDLDPVFGVSVPKTCPGVPIEALTPRATWTDPSAYDLQAQKLAKMFHVNFVQFASDVPEEVLHAGPII
ncbi:MAG: phosphoenolpyruvate carboxykinase (ATP) [Anaerolineaceae bacterium]